MSSQKNDEFLLQLDWRKGKLDKFGTTNWVKVYSIEDKAEEQFAVFSALIPNERINEVLSESDWEISIGEVRPGPVSYGEDGQVKTKYEHFTDPDSIQPLVLVRTFNGAKPQYIEILEEFKLFHNLYYDQLSGNYIKIFDNGNEDEIIRVQGKNVEIRLRELIQFISWKNMHLALYYDIVRFTEIPLKDIAEGERRENHTDDYICYSFIVDKMDYTSKPDIKTLSRLHGKKLISPIPIEQTGMWDYAPEDEFENFIVGTNSRGEDIITSAKPEESAYLTPVFFRRDIIRVYYSDPEKYQVNDGDIERKGRWILQIDSNHPDYIVAYLGDLGNLPYSEQRIWKSYNVAPDGEISEIAYRRSIVAEFTEPSAAHFKFKSKYAVFQTKWYEKFGWHLFRPLTERDKHHLDTLHLPVSHGQLEFDTQIISLTKLLIDSLNEAELAKHISAMPPNTKGISKFKLYLDEENVQDREIYIKFLRDLQEIRSISSAHRKGSDFANQIRKAGINSLKLRDEFGLLLEKANEILDGLTKHFLS